MADETKRPGRPTKLTDELAAVIIADIEQGVQPDAAAADAGIAPSTYFDWMQRGKAGEEPFRGFRSEVARARLAAESKLTKTILNGDERGMGFGPSKAALEMLSRLRPDRYSPTMKVQLRDDLERILDVVERVCGQESFLAVVEALADDDSARAAGEAASEPSVH